MLNKKDIVVIIITTLLTGVVIGIKIGENLMHKVAIENNVARFNPKTANFEWKKIK